MLLHLLQTLAAHPSLAEGLAPPGLLHPVEQKQFDALRVVKRRRDWLLGRWTAKHLVQQYVTQTQGGGTQGGETPPLRAIVILAASDGAPYAALDQEPPAAPSQPVTRNPQPDTRHSPPPLPISLSISHSGDRAFCALTDQPGASIGADIERIEPREPGFVEQFFTSAEIAAVQAALPGQRDMLITAIWSAKEAVLKALRVGLRADTRHLTCEFPGVPAPPANWTPCQVKLHAPHLSLSQDVTLIDWWRADDEYVQTLALIAPSPVLREHYPSS